MKKDIIFILSSLNDPHFRKRVEEFLDYGYQVKVFGFKRKGQSLPVTRFTPIILGEIENRNFASRIHIFRRRIKAIAKECNGKLCFYSSLDIALFARFYIKSPYIYEVCDLTELTIRNSIIRRFLSATSAKIIKASQKTIITSEGFLDYFKNLPKEKFYLIPNKVSPEIPKYVYRKRTFCSERIKIGFVGNIRFESIYHFVKVCSDFSRNVEVHLFGIYSVGDKWANMIYELEQLHKNIFYHGRFTNPADLPSIYNKIDLLLCTYPPTLGVMYAEPNKLYEAIYFRCPIIVSEKVFLGEKVRNLNIGYVIDSMDENKIKQFLSSLNSSDYQSKIESCESISQEDCLNNNEEFFKQLDVL